MTPIALTYGIRANLGQFGHQLLQVFMVGLTVGMMRTVVPALAESEFGVPAQSFALLAAFVIAFGVVKGGMNFLAGHLSERLGRRRVLLIGWLVALPIPFMILHAPNWNWIVAATLLLGINQGLTWSMALTAKLDLTRPQQKGLVNGLNEFSGYLAVAVAGVITGYLATAMGPRQGLFVFGLTVIIAALALVLLGVRETRPWAESGSASPEQGAPSTGALFLRMSWGDKRLFAFCQAGLVEKFTDAIIWLFYPIFFLQQGLSLPQAAWVVGIYGTVWGASQLLTGPLSDRIGRRWPIIIGMWLCAVGVGITPLLDGLPAWSLAAALTGFGMALLYPTLGAAVADIAEPAWRGTALGIYRFWRDLGYAVGALALGLAAQLAGQLEAGFWLVSASMLVSGVLVLWLGEETRPRQAN